MRKRLLMLVVAVGFTAFTIVPAVASADSAGNNASLAGQTHGAFADVNGDFGFLGANRGTPG
jgi:hypothetical protein